MPFDRAVPFELLPFELMCMKPPAALLTLDWLLREPDKAVASLRKGHDWVRVPPRKK